MGFFVKKRLKTNIIVALPASVLSILPSLREKTILISSIARTLSIFRVDKLIIYRDRESKRRDIVVFKDVLNYILTPPYLRRTVVRKKPTLRYVGVAKPLQIPSHIVSSALTRGEYREGVIVAKRKYAIEVDIGLSEPILLRVRDSSKFKRGQRIVVFIKDVNPIKACIISDREKADVYLGFQVVFLNKITSIIERYKDSENIVIATSKYGKYIGNIVKQLTEKLRKSNQIVILFGGPKKGLYEIFADEGLNLDNYVDFVLNFVKNQGTRTIRTEEALPIVLSIMDFLLEQ